MWVSQRFPTEIIWKTNSIVECHVYWCSIDHAENKNWGKRAFYLKGKGSYFEI